MRRNPFQFFPFDIPQGGRLAHLKRVHARVGRSIEVLRRPCFVVSVHHDIRAGATIGVGFEGEKTRSNQFSINVGKGIEAEKHITNDEMKVTVYGTVVLLPVKSSIRKQSQRVVINLTATKLGFVLAEVIVPRGANFRLDQVDCDGQWSAALPIVLVRKLAGAFITEEEVLVRAQQLGYRFVPKGCTIVKASPPPPSPRTSAAPVAAPTVQKKKPAAKKSRRTAVGAKKKKPATK